MFQCLELGLDLPSSRPLSRLRGTLLPPWADPELPQYLALPCSHQGLMVICATAAFKLPGDRPACKGKRLKLQAEAHSLLPLLHSLSLQPPLNPMDSSFCFSRPCKGAFQ